MRRFTCITCRKIVHFEGGLPPLFPFCCRRCQMVDLGRWLNEEYAIEAGIPVERAAGEPPDEGPGTTDERTS